MRFVVPFVWLSATAAVASTPAAEAPGGAYVAVIWGGGKDTEAARASVAKWELLAKSLVLAEGSPKTVSSRKEAGVERELREPEMLEDKVIETRELNHDKDCAE